MHKFNIGWTKRTNRNYGGRGNGAPDTPTCIVPRGPSYFGWGPVQNLAANTASLSLVELSAAGAPYSYGIVLDRARLELSGDTFATGGAAAVCSFQLQLINDTGDNDDSVWKYTLASVQLPAAAGAGAVLYSGPWHDFAPGGLGNSVADVLPGAAQVCGTGAGATSPVTTSLPRLYLYTDQAFTGTALVNFHYHFE